MIDHIIDNETETLFFYLPNNSDSDGSEEELV